MMKYAMILILLMTISFACVDLDDPASVSADLNITGNMLDGFNVIGDVTLCEGTYYLTDDDYLGAIIIDADDVTFDCNNANLVSAVDHSGIGIMNNGSDTVTIINCNVTNFYIGVGIVSSSNNYLIDNLISDNDMYGLIVRDSLDTIILSNQVTNNNWVGISYSNSNGGTLMANNVSSNSHVGLMIMNSSNNNFMNNDVNHGRTVDSKGFLINDEGSSLSNLNGFFFNRANYNGYGFYVVTDGINNSYSNNNANNNTRQGYFISGDSPYSLAYNHALNNGGDGFSLNAHDSYFIGNHANYNGRNGFYLSYSENNIFEDLVSYNNSEYGFNMNGIDNNNFTNIVSCGNAYSDLYERGVGINIFNNSNYSTSNPVDSSVYFNQTGTCGISLVPDIYDCVNLSDSLTFGTAVEQLGDQFLINEDVTLCTNEYGLSVDGAEGLLIINSSSIILDCNGASFVGDGLGAAIINVGFDDVTITNCTISNYDYGIVIDGFSSSVSLNVISNNVLEYNRGTGILVYGINNSQFINNNLSYNGFGDSIYKGGLFLIFGDDNTISNTISNYNSGSGIIIFSSNNNEFSNNYVNDNYEYGLIVSAFPSDPLSVSNTFTSTMACGNGISGIEYEDIKDEGGTGSNTFISSQYEDSSPNDVIYFNQTETCSLYRPGDCVDLMDDTTYGPMVTKVVDDYYIHDNVTLCTGTYHITDVPGSNPGAIIINESSITLDCNGATLNGTTGIGYGIYNNGFDNVTVTNCHINDYSNGIYLDSVFNNSMNGNVINYNDEYGYSLNNVNDSTISNNDLHSNGFGVFVNDGLNNTIEYNQIIDNIYRGIYLVTTSNNELIGNHIQNNNMGMVLFMGSNLNLVRDNTINDNIGVGLHVHSANNNSFNGNEISHNAGHGINLDNAFYNEFTSTILYGNGINPEFYNIFSDSGDNIFNDTLIYGTDRYVMYAWDVVDNNLTFNDLIVGYGDTLAGRINWAGPIVLDNVTILNSTNLIIEPTFVSLDSDDVNIVWFNQSAVISVNVDGCSGLDYSTLSEHTDDRALILSSGISFAPEDVYCSGNVVTFNVDGFSAYTAVGSRSSSGGSDDDSDDSSCRWNSDCLSTESCDSGSCTLIECNGSIINHRCIDLIVDDERFGCTINTDCTNLEVCQGGMCVALDCGECQYVQDHECLAYACCDDSDCLGIETCEDNNCVSVPCECGQIIGGLCNEYECCSNDDCEFICNNHACVIPEVIINGGDSTFGNDNDGDGISDAHTVNLLEIGNDYTGDWVSFNIDSGLNSVKLYEGQSIKIDLDNDGSFDVSIFLNSVSDVVSMGVLSLEEHVDTVTTVNESTDTEDEPVVSIEFPWTIVVGIIILLLLIAVAIFVIKRKVMDNNEGNDNDVDNVSGDNISNDNVGADNIDTNGTNNTGSDYQGVDGSESETPFSTKGKRD